MKKSLSPPRADKIEGLKSVESINKIIASRLNEKFGRTADIDFNKVDINKILRINQEPLEEEENTTSVPITEEEIEEFIKIMNPYDPTYIKKENLQCIIDAFPNFFSQKDLNLMMNKQTKLSKKDLFNMLKDNKLPKDFNPLKETFKFLSNDKDYIDAQELSVVLKKLNFCEVSNADMQILKKVADINQDGKITFEDFNSIFEKIQKEKEDEKIRQQQLIEQDEEAEKAKEKEKEADKTKPPN
jgi:Ca2+-binding EF-hand superfamily protein